MMTKEELEIKLRELAEKNNVDINEANIKKIINAKFLLFGNEGKDETLYKCPCDADNPNRGCISKLCLSDIERDGLCHCRLMKKK